MFNAKEAKQLMDESIEKRLEENLAGLIQEACREGKDYILVDLSAKEKAILEKAGYSVKFTSVSAYKVSWSD